MTTDALSGGPFGAVLRDLDNVIRFYDTSRLAALERAAGLPAGTTAAVAFAPEVDLPLLLGRVTRRRWARSVALALAEREPGLPYARARELGEALAGAPFRADAAVVALLRRVRERMPLVLVTNASLELDEDLAAMGLTGLAHRVVNSALEGVAKPDRGIYEIAAARAGVPAARCLFVDDRPENVAAAAALGMTGLVYRGPDGLAGALGLRPARPGRGEGEGEGEERERPGAGPGGAGPLSGTGRGAG
ncbi:HAD-IA family hydrolase [Streptomyces sp. TRM 70361]|uniref:HAD family hydrolase n=1 Tax=Streptomyces sp. TRM 70361 TaxID=3116553 RepID=UPI002E7B6778|nr:HAD-IA family hydrolase [Streptomyces sp. TRM 70361]MEE1942701.1 HAD-IA family hydrolase [Streptomyces sp. TRM 70361]